MPPVHPQFGPAVFDYNYYCWTYPYAHWYNPNHQQPTMFIDAEMPEAPSPPELVDEGT